MWHKNDVIFVIFGTFSIRGWKKVPFEWRWRIFVFIFQTDLLTGFSHHISNNYSKFSK